MGINILQASLECAIDYAQKREAFNQPIAKMQTVQVCVVNIYRNNIYLDLRSNCPLSINVIRRSTSPKGKCPAFISNTDHFF